MDRINDKMEEIMAFLEDLDEITPESIEDYASNKEKKAACERYFEKILEAITDTAFYVKKIKMSLETYKEKRKFSGTDKTNEPEGKVGKKLLKGKLGEENRRLSRFVIHKHHASHLHWDLRLEMDGVLKSWAVPKEPPTTKEVKRLAVQVEDHPLEYASFEGTIPEGNYGAGKVEIWDNGKYVLLEKTSNKILFNLKGKKLTGNYILIKTSYGSKPGKSW